VSGRIRSGDVSMLYWEQRDGVHWACLGVGSNGDLVWLGLASLTLAVARVSSGHSRHRVAGTGRGARGLALQEIRWDAFGLSLRFSCGDEDVLWESVLRETLPWGDPSHRAVVRMSNGESVLRETLSWGDPSHRVAGNGRIVGGLGPLGKMSKGGECPSGDSSLGRSFLLGLELVRPSKGRCLRESVLRETLLGRSLWRKPLGLRFTSMSFGC